MKLATRSSGRQSWDTISICANSISWSYSVVVESLSPLNGFPTRPARSLFALLLIRWFKIFLTRRTKFFFPLSGSVSLEELRRCWKTLKDNLLSTLSDPFLVLYILLFLSFTSVPEPRGYYTLFYVICGTCYRPFACPSRCALLDQPTTLRPVSGSAPF